jgi:hypothetical protein
MGLKARKTTKRNSTFAILGYTAQDLADHITKLLSPGMTWENYGKAWHIDHVRSVSSYAFDPSNQESIHDFIKKCWAVNNLQPLFRHENMSKGARYDG